MLLGRQKGRKPSSQRTRPALLRTPAGASRQHPGDGMVPGKRSGEPVALFLRTLGCHLQHCADSAGHTTVLQGPSTGLPQASGGLSSAHLGLTSPLLQLESGICSSRGANSRLVFSLDAPHRLS